MQPFTTLTGIAAPLPIPNVDTDKIIPARFLKTIKRSGLGKNLFDAMRFRADGSENPDFILNQPRAQHAQVLLAGDNFGCGSSREHAPWALTQFGFRAVISTSFADIFKQNSLKNSLLPIVLPADVHTQLFEMVEKDPDAKVAIDLAAQAVTLPDGRKVEFTVDQFARHCMLEGVDELGYIQKNEAAIDEHLKEVAPSEALRKWFGHDPARWAEFRRRYERELDGKAAQVVYLGDKSERRAVTLLYAAKDPERNNAVVLKDYLLKARKRRPA